MPDSKHVECGKIKELYSYVGTLSGTRGVSRVPFRTYPAVGDFCNLFKDDIPPLRSVGARLAALTIRRGSHVVPSPLAYGVHRPIPSEPAGTDGGKTAADQVSEAGPGYAGRGALPVHAVRRDIPKIITRVITGGDYHV